ncbi:MAG: hypothetical protein HY959_00450 [Ignavibacteriae bacterium]|nr:hypothetical protein [Ignavibacteriota bacterium]
MIILRTLVLLVLHILTAELLPAQDSASYKILYTKDFELLMESSRTLHYKTGKWDTETNYKFYFDCNKLTPLSDSSFSVRHNEGSDLLLYKNINEITFYGKNRFGKGLKWGALTGLGVGIIAELLFLSYDARGEEGIGKAIALIFSIPFFTGLGTITGGIYGALTRESESYDFTRYPINQRRDMTYNILIKHQINF